MSKLVRARQFVLTLASAGVFLGSLFSQGVGFLISDRAESAAADSLVALQHFWPTGSCLADAERLASSWRADDKRAAIPLFQRMLPIVRDETLKARISAHLGDLHGALGLLRESIPFYQRAIESSSAEPETRAHAQIGLSRSFLKLDKFHQGIRYARRAVGLTQAVGDGRHELTALNTLGMAFYDARDLEQSADTLRRAMRVAEKRKDRDAFAEARLHLAFIYGDQNDDWGAVKELRGVIDMSRELGDPNLETMAWVALGHVQSKLGDKHRALEAYQRAAPMLQEIGDPYTAASFHIGMGYLYDELGDLTIAGDFYTRALELNKAMGSVYGISACLIHLSRVQAADGNFGSALRSLKLALTHVERLDDDQMVSVVMNEIANVQASLGNEHQARDSYLQALALSRSGRNERLEAEIENAIGELLLRAGDVTEAGRRFEHATELSRKTGSPFNESRALFNQARIQRAAGRLEDALGPLDEALDKIERLRLNVRSHRLRTSYLASIHEMNVFRVDVLMELYGETQNARFDRLAFVAAESAKARSLTDMLREEEVSKSNCRPDPSLAEHEAGLVQRLHERARVEDSESLRRLVAELDRIRSLMRAESCGHYDGPRATIIDVEELQKEALNEKTVLLAYFLGDAASYGWTITRSSFASHRLPAGKNLEIGLRRIHGLLAHEAVEGETAIRRRRRMDRLDRFYWDEAAALSEVLLGPVMPYLEGATRLVIVGDGLLHQIPFSSLPIPRTANRHEHVPLMSRFEIVRLPSVSTLKALGERRRARPVPSKELAVLADPVLDETDPRLVRQAASRPISSASAFEKSPFLETNARTRFFSRDGAWPRRGLSRLPATRIEARRILDLVPPSKRFEALGFDASRALVTSGRLSQYRILHFATHGIVNVDLPELSGIALSLFDDQGARTAGFLRLADLYALDLPVELVVLSACSTGLGQQVRGEGNVGLVSGFLAAGSQSVIASYWDVGDEATAELMVHFYKHAITERRNPSRALQLAQISLAKEKRWQSPRFWAAFEFHGDWK